jgi:phosphotransferase system enzyme I (PtsI)
MAAIVLVGMGIDELSMGPGVLLEMKKLVRSISFEDARLSAEQVTRLTTADEISTFLRERYAAKLDDLGLGRFPTSKRPAPF